MLYCGLAVHGADVRVVEFNVRFGDPETQVVLPRLTSPLSALLAAAAVGDLTRAPAPAVAPTAAVNVVIANEGYPGPSASGRPIRGLQDAESIPGVHVDHASTAASGSDLLATGGRVVSVIGVGDDLAAARDRAYRGVAAIALEGSHHRTDIAADAALGAVLTP